MTDKRNVHQRIAAVMEAVTYIQKEKKDKMLYSIVSHDKVTAKVRPALLKEGVIYYPVRCEHIQNGNRAECSMTVRFTNIEEPTDFIDVQTFGYGIDAQDKGPGKAQSYAVKYALLKALGLETGDDADHDSIEHTPIDPQIHASACLAAIQAINSREDNDELRGYWETLYSNQRPVADAPKVIKAKDERKTQLETKQKAA